MSQKQVQRKAEQAKQQSQAFSKTIYNSSLEVFDATTSVAYFLVGAAYGICGAVVGLAYNPKVQRDAKQAVNGIKADVTDGAYDIKARVANSTEPAINDAKTQASGVSKQAQGTASDLSKQAQSKAHDVKKQAASQGKQVQGQFKQTAQANGVRA